MVYGRERWNESFFLAVDHNAHTKQQMKNSSPEEDEIYARNVVI